MRIFCPYCTKEINPHADQCSSCGRIFGDETRKFLHTALRKSLSVYPDDQRKHARFHKTFRVTFATPDALKKYYLSDISPGGLFIKTGDPLRQGEVFKLKMFLPGNGTALDALCEVVWSHEEQWVTPAGTFPPGMGVRFVEPSKETIDRILGTLSMVSD